jgi:bacillithiol biosynthesis cysteine-adding enzyme BshC
MSDSISYEKTCWFKPIFIDYINQKLQLSPFYNLFPQHNNFKAQINEKAENYNQDHREILVKQLNEQYLGLDVSELTQNHINQLTQDNTFTISTGHQLNLFTGPVYTFYKIISVINSCKKLKKQYPDFNFVPVFWLASEDHDFDEINHFHLDSQTLSWNEDTSGAVGEIFTEGLEHILDDFKKLLPDNQKSEYLISLFNKTYLEHKDLSSASIFLYNELFGEYGLVILEPNTPKLKSVFKPYIKQELFSQPTFEKVNQTTERLLKLGYHEQVTPREINFFYKNEKIRERLIYKDERYFVNDTELSFSKDEVSAEIDNHPERFSPNALLRPLYQEVLLPNLSYVGGAGELAYWLQLKSTFKAFDITFPMLQMRNSALLYSEKTIKKLNKLDVSLEDLFQPQMKLKNQHVKRISDIEIDFTPQKNHLTQQFKNLYKLAEKTDKTFLNAVSAQEKKQHNGLDKLEKRLLKAQRRKLKDEVERLVELQAQLFPNQSLQERYINFSDIYLTCSDSFIDFLMDNLDPFNFKFSLLELVNNPKTIPEKFTSDSI